MTDVHYDAIGDKYALTRREDPRVASLIQAALGNARTVVNLGAGAGSYEPRNRHVLVGGLFCPSGAAVEALSRVMAADLADSPVTVNLLLPGALQTPGWSPTTPQRSASGCSTPRSWDRRSAGSPHGGSRRPQRADRRRRVRAVASSAMSTLPYSPSGLEARL
jgi:NAD(P)-dependent dehydrogenase (short-subunit alcohol dehydrogenase family)